MGEFCFSCMRARRPRLFLIFCCLFSVALGAMSSLFFYYPDGVNIPMFATSDGIVLNHGHGHGHMHAHGSGRIIGHMEQSDHSSSIGGGGGAVVGSSSSINNDKNRHHLFFQINNDEEYEGSGKIRHLAHHFDHERYESSGNEYKPHLEFGIQELEEKSSFSNIVAYRLFHLDLKGAPPRVSYIKEILKIAKAAGINGVLIEWEDTFPWRGSLQNLTLLNGGYNLTEVEEILDYCNQLSMEVIPLIQTFGHAEFILKSEELKHLREEIADPQSFCPSKPQTMEIITEMINQIFEVHRNSRYIHLGMDEVHNIHSCSLCTAAFETRDDVFLNHVTRVATLVKSRDRIPIIWDDMLRSIPAKSLIDSGIGSLVEPMVWVYAEDIDRFVGWESWDKYSKIFPTVWAAAAFKGAFGETLTIPPLSRHAENAQRWVDVIARESVRWKLGVGGLVLTGWQRYDHFAVLCELLPSAIPSLVYTSLVISTPKGGEVIRNRVFIPKNITSSTSIPESQSVPSPTVSIGGAISPAESNDKQVLEATPLSSESQMNNNDNYIISSSTSKSNLSPPPPLPSEESSPQFLSRSERSTRRKIPHPRSLMQKESALSRFSGSSGTVDMRPLHARELISEVTDKNELISKHFNRILHCSSHPENIAVMIKEGGDTELSFASKCNFPGVSFFRTLFRLRSLLNEVWELQVKISRGRAWVTQFNVRHNYSLPSRIDEVIFSQVPRFRRNLSLTAKAAAVSLKTIFKGEVVLEWIEQNLWEAYEVLDNFEKVGERLKRINTWPRRPLPSPRKMIEDLGLQIVDLFDHEEL